MMLDRLALPAEFSRAGMLLGALALGAALLAAAPATEISGQQFIFEGPGQLPDGSRIGIFLPSAPVALGVQSKSGPRVLTVGDLLNCQPFEETSQVFRKTANGGFEPLNDHQQLLNCGPLAPGGADRILAVVGIQWRQRTGAGQHGVQRSSGE